MEETIEQSSARGVREMQARAESATASVRQAEEQRAESFGNQLIAESHTCFLGKLRERNQAQEGKPSSCAAWKAAGQESLTTHGQESPTHAPNRHRQEFER